MCCVSECPAVPPLPLSHSDTSASFVLACAGHAVFQPPKLVAILLLLKPFPLAMRSMQVDNIPRRDGKNTANLCQYIPIPVKKYSNPQPVGITKWEHISKKINFFWPFPSVPDTTKRSADLSQRGQLSSREISMKRVPYWGLKTWQSNYVQFDGPLR